MPFDAQDDPLAFITREVKAELAFSSGQDEDDIEPGDSLKDDLGLGESNLKALARPFEDLARRFNPGADINRDECAALDTVRECIELVAKRAGIS